MLVVYGSVLIVDVGACIVASDSVSAPRLPMGVRAPSVHRVGLQVMEVLLPACAESRKNS